MNARSPCPSLVVVLPHARRVLADGAPVLLGDRALDLLLALSAHADRVVDKEELLDTVWRGQAVEEGNLPVQVSALRRALGAAAVVTVHGRGYRLGAEVEVQRAARPAVRSAARALFGQHGPMLRLQALMNSARLVTLTGPGGVGKSCLAGQVLPRARWLDLSGLDEPALLWPALARALGCAGPAVSAVSAVSADDWVAALRQSADLAGGAWVVLDNAEHLLPALAAAVAALLQAAPRARLLVTSRQALGLADEQVFALASLSVPHSHSARGAAQSDAVQLFVARAQVADAHFDLDAATLPLVVDICRALDGLPLALEMAAGRLPLLGLQALRDSTQQGLAALRQPALPAQARHHSLQQLLDSGWPLLTGTAQRCLCRIALWHAPFTLGQALALAQPGEDRWVVTDALDLLRQHQYLRWAGPATDAGGQPRWHLPPPTRLWARQRLRSSGDETAARGRHAAHLASAFEALDAQWQAGAGTEAEIDQRAALWMDDLVAALQWACAAEGDPVQGLKLLRHGGRSLYLHGLRARAGSWAGHLHGQVRPLQTPEAQAALWLSALWVRPPGRPASAALLDGLRQAEQHCWPTATDAQRLNLCCAAALAAARAGDAPQASHWLTRAQALPALPWPPRVRARWLYTQLTLHQFLGLGHAPAPADMLDALDDLRASGDAHCRFALLLRIALGEWHLVQGRPAQAREQLQWVCDTASSHPVAGPLLAPYDTLAAAQLACGDPHAAAGNLRLALDAARRADLWAELACTWAWYLALCARWRNAAVLLGASRAHRCAHSLHLDPVQAVSDSAALALCSAACAPAELDRWLGEGRLQGGLRQLLDGPQPRFAL